MTTHTEDARRALRHATRARNHAGCARDVPVCVYDVCESLGVEVRFLDVPSLEGIYARQCDAILVSAARPRGRQAFTTAHELGHREFGHGDRVDEVVGGQYCGAKAPECRLADMFAGYLLMPHGALKRSFDERGWEPRTCNALQVFTIASQFSVSYEALVQHLSVSLNWLNRSSAKQFLSVTPKQIRQSILGHAQSRHVVVADRWWRDVAIDLQVGEHCVLPAKARVEGSSVSADGTAEGGVVAVGVRPGIAQASCRESGWSAFIRVSRQDYHGRAIYRHMEDPDGD